jgi:hypothetical protein
MATGAEFWLDAIIGRSKTQETCQPDIEATSQARTATPARRKPAAMTG